MEAGQKMLMLRVVQKLMRFVDTNNPVSEYAFDFTIDFTNERDL